MYRHAAEPKELFVVPEAAHSEAHAVAGDEYERRVLDFLARYLDGNVSSGTAAEAVGVGAPPV